ncbi:hypothetical protein LJC54_03765, partial [Parabacteroides sp. OttesenSCG-928-J18]|nr:hypothetical protein [Parabacteroides sp. OttesenSCG-928-J18]
LTFVYIVVEWLNIAPLGIFSKKNNYICLSKRMTNAVTKTFSTYNETLTNHWNPFQAGLVGRCNRFPLFITEILQDMKIN